MGSEIKGMALETGAFAALGLGLMAMGKIK